MLRWSVCARGVRPGNVQNGRHAVRTAQLPNVRWAFDSRYCGSSVESVIAKFKKPSFPKNQVDKELLNRKVEEVHAMAEKMKQKHAQQAMKLLNDTQFNNDTNQVW